MNMPMTKQHFIAIASRIRDDVDQSKSGRFSAAENKRTFDAATYAAHLFADVAQNDNPRFDRDRFLTACGLR